MNETLDALKAQYEDAVTRYNEYEWDAIDEYAPSLPTIRFVAAAQEYIERLEAQITEAERVIGEVSQCSVLSSWQQIGFKATDLADRYLYPEVYAEEQP